MLLAIMHFVQALFAFLFNALGTTYTHMKEVN